MTTETTRLHPMLNRRVLIRTNSAGVHIGYAASIDKDEVHLTNALRLWSWTDGGLSLSAIATRGVKKARIDRTGEVYLTNVIEIIPVSTEADASYARFIE